MWISKGVCGIGKDGEQREITRAKSLDILNNTKKVWAIGLCAMEAKHLGCKTIEYYGTGFDLAYPEDAIKELRKILDREVAKTQY